MAEEVKKTRKPRAPKKADAAAEVAVAVAETVEPKTTAAAQEETKKKAPAKRARKKAVEAQPEVVNEAQRETVEQGVAETENAPAAAKATKKRASKKQTKEVVKTEETAVGMTEEKVVQESVEPPEKAEEKPAKKGQKNAKKSAKNSEKTQEKEEKSSPKKEEKSVALTRAQKKEIVKKLTKEVLQTECKWADLVDRVALRYQEEYPTSENANLNDVKGRVGSVLHVMQESGEILVEGSLVKLPENAPKAEKESTVSATNEEKQAEIDLSNKVDTTEKAEEKTALAKVETAAPAPVYDLSALFDKGRSAKKSAAPKKSVGDLAQEKADELANTKPASEEETPTPQKEEKTASAEKKSAEKKPAEKAPAVKTPAAKVRKETTTRNATHSAKVDPLKEAFLKKLRSLGGNYFEYYAIYLLERYSRMNGRRLECLRVSGGEYDGGIDGELELTDRLGFRETIYIQAKNWEPTDERWWIGETLLQQFIGAVAYRQAKEGKQHCRGMFITTSAFTAGAKEMLEKMSDRFVGYDGDELYETAKECEFGLIKDGKGGWKIDEELLSGKKSFFFMV
ncbi:MAG: restriction endonuclease [Clostridia bacterium]|nr:restriction endonuclease [Clostridia bacterium]